MSRRLWSSDEVDFLRANIEEMSNPEIADVLGRSTNAVAKKCSKLGIKRSREARSRLQRNDDQEGENNPNWKGGVSQNPSRYTRQYKRDNPEKVRAHRLVQTEIRAGRMERQPCEVCGEPNGDAHHDDYDKPLEVRWLCRKHHIEFHSD